MLPAPENTAVFIKVKLHLQKTTFAEILVHLFIYRTLLPLKLQTAGVNAERAHDSVQICQVNGNSATETDNHHLTSHWNTYSHSLAFSMLRQPFSHWHMVEMTQGPTSES